MPRKRKRRPKITPNSTRVQYVDTSLGYEYPTPIYYELIEKNGKYIVRYYSNDKFMSARVLKKKIDVKNFKPEDHGGQNLFTARYQREENLVNIISSLFKRFNFEVSLNPKLGVYKPDIKLKKDNKIIYVEVKAYHASYICGDPEICQCLRYYNQAKDIDQAKVLLITSGELIVPKDSFLNNPIKNPIELVGDFYKKRVISRTQAKTLDLFSARDIYRQAKKKFEKKFDKDLLSINCVFLKNRHISKFPNCLIEDANFDVLLINATIFKKVLRNLRMYKELSKFKTLRQEPMERLIMNANLLNF